MYIHIHMHEVYAPGYWFIMYIYIYIYYKISHIGASMLLTVMIIIGDAAYV